MKKRATLMQGIQNEQEELKRQEDLREQEALRLKIELEKQEEEAKKQEEAYLQEEVKKQAELLLQEQKKEAAPIVETKKKSLISKFFSFIGRILIMCFNLLITLLEQLQWILFAVVLTIAVYVVCNHYNIDIASIIQQFISNLGL